MSADYVSKIASFTEDNLPDLDEVVLAALQFLGSASIPTIDVNRFKRPLVIGSVNALSTGKVIFSSVDAVFSEEGNYLEALACVPEIDALYIMSASGGKHATHIAEERKGKGLPVFLITSSENAPARAFIESTNVFVFPHIREPYTYNTSTYMGMMLGVSKESPLDLLTYIENTVAPLVPSDLSRFHSFILTVNPEFGILRSMFETKFDELFGSLRPGRSFTSEEIKHAKTVIPSETECFINFGNVPDTYGKESSRLHIPLPAGCGPVAQLAIGYYVIGCIQKQNLPFFKDNVHKYVANAGLIFNQSMSVIVE